MTNLQDGGTQVSGVWLRRFWLGLPIAVGGLLAFLVLATAVLPQWLALQRDMKRFSELEALRDQVARSRMQLQALDTAEEKTQALQAKLFEIVSGNGDLSTFMAMVDREAKLAGVQLDLFQPQPLTTPAKPGAPGAAASPAAPGTAPGQPPAGAQAGRPGQPGEPPAPANTEIKGLRNTTILLHARGPYSALVNFLHRIELLNVLVVQSNLVLEAVNKTDGSAPGAPQSREQPVLMKLQLMLYGREAPATPPAGAAVAGQPRIAAPPPATPRPGAPPTTPPAPNAIPSGNAPSTPSPTPTSPPAPPPTPAPPTNAPAR